MNDRFMRAMVYSTKFLAPDDWQKAEAYVYIPAIFADIGQVFVSDPDKGPVIRTGPFFIEHVVKSLTLVIGI